MVRITHHHAVIGPPNPIEIAVHTSDLQTHSWFGDHPGEFARLAYAVQQMLHTDFPQSVPLKPEEKPDAKPVRSAHRKSSRAPHKR